MSQGSPLCEGHYCIKDITTKTTETIKNTLETVDGKVNPIVNDRNLHNGIHNADVATSMNKTHKMTEGVK